MTETCTDADLDQLIWTMIQGSQQATDYLNYIRQSSDRKIQCEEAFELASTYWGKGSGAFFWPSVVQKLEDLVQLGSPKAMLRLGHWYRHGYGVEEDSDKALVFYKAGMELFDAKCFMAYGNMVKKEDPSTASALFQRAVELGCTMAHIYWADFDKVNYMDHMAKGALSREPHAMYCYAHDCLAYAKTEKEKEAAFDLLKEAAQAGSSSACVELGFSHLYGFQGVPEDNNSSAYWFLRASRFGNSIGMAALGKLILRSDPKNAEKALEWLFKAAMMGDPQGQFYLGQYLHYCPKTEEDPRKSIYWLETSANQRYKPAYYLLGEAYRQGIGVEADSVKAHEWFKLGADAGQPDCQCAMGIGHLYGVAVPKDEEQAHNLFSTASLQGSGWGLYLLGRTYEDGTGVQKDLQKAFDCYKQGAEKNYEKACFALAMAYLYGDGVKVNCVAAARWFKTASDLGHTDAKVYLGLFFLNGTGVEESVEKAMFWLKSAAEDGSKTAMRELGTLYFEGDKVRLDLEEAKRWMAQAASHGDPAAIQWIKDNCPEKPQWLNTLLLESNKSQQEPKDI